MVGVEHTCDLADAAATQDLGRRLAADLLRHPAAGPALLLLQGDLGAMPLEQAISRLRQEADQRVIRQVATRPFAALAESGEQQHEY